MRCTAHRLPAMSPTHTCPNIAPHAGRVPVRAASLISSLIVSLFRPVPRRHDPCSGILFFPVIFPLSYLRKCRQSIFKIEECSHGAARPALEKFILPCYFAITGKRAASLSRRRAEIMRLRRVGRVDREERARLAPRPRPALAVAGGADHPLEQFLALLPPADPAGRVEMALRAGVDEMAAPRCREAVRAVELDPRIVAAGDDARREGQGRARRGMGSPEIVRRAGAVAIGRRDAQ